MDITLHPSESLRLAEQRWLRRPLHQDIPLLEVRYLPHLFAQHSLHGRAKLSYYFTIQEFRGLHPFPLYASLLWASRQQAVTCSTSFCNTVLRMHGWIGWTGGTKF